MGEQKYSGKFIVFEGPDGSGKSTLVKRCADRFREEFTNYELNVRRFPTDMHAGGLLRHAFLGGELPDRFTDYGLPQTRIVQILAWADRAIEAKVKDGLWDRLHRGHIIFCDRYTGSREAYQIADRILTLGKNEEMITAQLEEIAREERDGITMPQEDLVVHVSLPVKEGLARLTKAYIGGRQPELFEREKFLEAVAYMFDRLAAKRPNWQTAKAMDGERSLSPEEMEHKVFNDILYPFFDREGIRRTK